MANVKRGRPKSPDKRQAILSVARQSFTQYPYERVSIDAIAETAGVSKVTIYSHFENKEALFVAAISDGCEQIFAEVHLSGSKRRSLRSKLHQLGCKFLAMIMDPEIDRLHAIMLSEGARHPELSKLFYESVIVRSTQVLANYLDEQVSAGTLKKIDPYNSAVQFLAMIQGNLRYRSEMGVQPPAQTEIDIYVRGCIDTLILAWAKIPELA